VVVPALGGAHLALRVALALARGRAKLRLDLVEVRV
jgi:hypothetical protein